MSLHFLCAKHRSKLVLRGIQLLETGVLHVPHCACAEVGSQRPVVGEWGNRGADTPEATQGHALAPPGLSLWKAGRDPSIFKHLKVLSAPCACPETPHLELPPPHSPWGQAAYMNPPISLLPSAHFHQGFLIKQCLQPTLPGNTILSFSESTMAAKGSLPSAPLLWESSFNDRS